MNNPSSKNQTGLTGIEGLFVGTTVVGPSALILQSPSVENAARSGSLITEAVVDNYNNGNRSTIGYEVSDVNVKMESDSHNDGNGSTIGYEVLGGNIKMESAQDTLQGLVHSTYPYGVSGENSTITRMSTAPVQEYELSQLSYYTIPQPALQLIHMHQAHQQLVYQQQQQQQQQQQRSQQQPLHLAEPTNDIENHVVQLHLDGRGIQNTPITHYAPVLSLSTQPQQTFQVDGQLSNTIYPMTPEQIYQAYGQMVYMQQFPVIPFTGDGTSDGTIDPSIIRYSASGYLPSLEGVQSSASEQGYSDTAEEEFPEVTQYASTPPGTTADFLIRSFEGQLQISGMSTLQSSLPTMSMPEQVMGQLQHEYVTTSLPSSPVGTPQPHVRKAHSVPGTPSMEQIQLQSPGSYSTVSAVLSPLKNQFGDSALMGVNPMDNFSDEEDQQLNKSANAKRKRVRKPTKPKSNSPNTSRIVLKCQLCSVTCSSAPSLARHKETHKWRGMYAPVRCEACHNSLSNEFSVQRHIKRSLPTSRCWQMRTYSFMNSSTEIKSTVRFYPDRPHGKKTLPVDINRLNIRYPDMMKARE